MGQGNLARLLLAVAAAALVALVAGCGGGSSSSSTTGSGSTAGSESDSSGGSTTEPGSTTDNSKLEPSAEFRQPGNSGVGQFVNFGKEAPAAERAAASQVLTENFEARATADFATQCATLDRSTQEALGASKKMGTAAGVTACAQGLGSLAEPLEETKEARADLLAGPISALRVKGNRAYAFYHGTDKNDYAMLMTKEDGKWKVGSYLNVDLGCTPSTLGCAPASAPSAPK